MSINPRWLVAWLEGLPVRLSINNPSENHRWDWPIWKRFLFTYPDPLNLYSIGLVLGLLNFGLHLDHFWLLWIPPVLVASWAFVRYVEVPTHDYGNGPVHAMEWEDVRDAVLALLLLKALLGDSWW